MKISIINTDVDKKCLLKSNKMKSKIVCKDHLRIREYLRMSKELNLEIPEPITYHDLLIKNDKSRGVRNVIIDDLEYFIHLVSGNIEIDEIFFRKEINYSIEEIKIDIETIF